MPLTSLPGDHPVRDIAILGHFHRAKDRHVDLAAPDHRKALGAVEIGRVGQRRDGLLAGIDQIGVNLILCWEGANAQHPVFGLQGDMHAFGNVIGHQRGNADAKIDIHTILQFLRRARGHLVTVPGHL